MCSLLIAKASSVPKFRHTLIDTGDNIVAESTDNPYWGCGFVNEVVALTLTQHSIRVQYVRKLAYDSKGYRATSDSDSSSSSDGSDTENDEEMDESPPATVAVTPATASLSTQSVL